jgi:hypothetical protein
MLRRRRARLWLIALLALGCRVRSPAPVAAAPWTVVPIGLCEDYPEETRTMDEVRRDIALMTSAGIRVLRVSIGWDGIEPARGHYDLKFWDDFFAAMGAAGIRVIPYIAYTPRWASSSAGDDFWRAPPADLDAFGATVGMLARRYRGRVSSWEIWNEPDNRDYWRGTVAQFAALLRVGARAVRAADPAAKVVFGGVAGHPAFVAEVMAQPALADVADTIDVINAHAYFETWNPDPIESLPRYVQAFAPVLGQGARALWLAEMGYSNYRQGAVVSGDVRARADYEHTLAFQAVALVRTVTLALAQPQVALVAWYEMKDPRPDAPMIGDDNNRHLGVAFSDWRPKPALAALALVQHLLGHGFRRLDGQLRARRDPGSRAEVHAFLTPEGEAVVVAWIPTAGAAEHLSLTLAGMRATGAARGWDAEGHPREARLDGLELRAGEVAVVEVPVSADRP